MDFEFLKQSVLPALIAIAFMLGREILLRYFGVLKDERSEDFLDRVACKALQLIQVIRLAYAKLVSELKQAPSEKIFNAVSGVALLLVQLALIVYTGLSTPKSLIIVFLVLAVLISSLYKSWPNFNRAAILSFGLFIFYWALEKYLLPFGFGSWISSLSQSLSRMDHSLHVLAIVGISYIGFKLIHFVVDLRSGAITNFAIVDVLEWLFFFPSIIAGPMQRYQDWSEQQAYRRLSYYHMTEGIQRLATGIFMKYVLADSIYPLTLTVMTVPGLDFAPLPRLFVGAAAYSFYLYWDFCGYSHMAIGLGHFFGIKLPENFRRPFLARNLTEFWNRWHITLSEILRDYLYYPLTLRIKRSTFGRSNPNFAAAAPAVITFAIAGIWHGAGVTFLIFGLLHGVGLGYLAVAKRRRNTGRLHKWWLSSKIGYAISCALTFCYVTFTFLFFALSTEKLGIIFNRVGSSVIFLAHTLQLKLF